MPATVTITTKLTQEMANVIDKLVEQGDYSSKSEALRDAVRLMIRAQRGMLKSSGLPEQISEEQKAVALEELAKEKRLRL